ncbi:MAG: hypothetical protein CVV25_13890 [Ignavibacteriae bacterium HGW-Ignavibacteriae-4]|jgi:aspartate kinase|nr:MAG: hypothetical protein CVV25_13890 [Ignavibacteriae bacterium HGW-Ignavibacteriae-4]
MKIIKIGGTALSNISSIIGFTNTINNSKRPILLVISAFGKLSSSLKNFDFSSNFTQNSSPFYFFREFSSVLTKSECVEFFTYLEKVELILTKRTQGVAISGEFPPKVLDEILSLGELVSSYFVHCLLNSLQIDNEFIDARDLIKTDSNYGNAKLELDKSIANIKKQTFSSDVIITQGFIASDSSNITTTMGFESSNLSATIFANALDSSDIEIVTKVNQIFSSDPEHIKNARPISKIPYSSAGMLANNGFKMLFPGMIDLAEKNDINIVYRGIENTGISIISKDSEFDYPIILKTNFGFLVSPISSENAIRIIENFDSKITEYSFVRSNNTLTIKSSELDMNELHDFAISLF